LEHIALFQSNFNYKEKAMPEVIKSGQFIAVRVLNGRRETFTVTVEVKK
jgi:hypothetical protein